jgi:hypothetical protein
MQLNRVGVLGLFLVGLAPCAQADESAGNPGRATIRAVIHFCAQIDPTHRADYEALRAVALANEPKGDDDDGGGRATYLAVTAALDQVPQNVALADCTAAIAGISVTGGNDKDGRD